MTACATIEARGKGRLRLNERVNSRLTVQTVKAGINDHFNWKNPLVARC